MQRWGPHWGIAGGPLDARDDTQRNLYRVLNRSFPPSQKVDWSLIKTELSNLNFQGWQFCFLLLTNNSRNRIRSFNCQNRWHQVRLEFIIPAIGRKAEFKTFISGRIFMESLALELFHRFVQWNKRRRNIEDLFLSMFHIFSYYGRSRIFTTSYNFSTYSTHTWFPPFCLCGLYSW